MEALEMTLLYDYYGELLSERQRICLDMRYNQDMSLAEIAEQLGVSRQGVHDNLSRAEEFLLRTENTVGCIRRAGEIRAAAAELLRIAEKLDNESDTAASGYADAIRSAVSRLEE